MKNNQLSSAQKPQIVQICEDRAGQRIDNFLMASFREVPKSRVYSMLRKGEVRVNKGRVKANYRLQTGDAVRIPPVRLAEPAQVGRPGANVLGLIEKSILVEEKGFLVLNKPSGLAVHGGSGLSYGLIEALRQLRPDAPYLELVHRLDRDTSGCLIIAKKRSMLRELHRLLRGEGGQIHKRYFALLKGRWQGGQRRVDAPLLKNTLRSGERVVTVSQEGKQALSIFRPVAIYKDASLVEVELLTGRTHQIRVHAASIGHPIAGDEKYGDTDFNRSMKDRGLKRLFLHAHRLTFPLPEMGEFTVSAPMPGKLDAVISRLEENGARQQDMSDVES